MPLKIRPIIDESLEKSLKYKKTPACSRPSCLAKVPLNTNDSILRLCGLKQTEKKGTTETEDTLKDQTSIRLE